MENNWWSSIEMARNADGEKQQELYKNLQELDNQTINKHEFINNLIRTRKWIRTKDLYQERITRSCDQDFRWGKMFATGLEDTWSKYISKEPDLKNKNKYNN